MKIAILSDVHAAIEALDAVLEAATTLADRVVLLGDLVGYYADPNACVERIRQGAIRFGRRRSRSSGGRSPRYW